MNYTKASCGHGVIAVGSPGSTARLECENEPCNQCKENNGWLGSYLTSHPKVKELSKPDRDLHICLNGDTNKATLEVTRWGFNYSYPISNAVAAELIAAGISYGN